MTPPSVTTPAPPPPPPGLRGSLRRRRLTSDPDEEPESLDLPDSAADGPPGGERQTSADVEDTSPDNQTLLRLLEHGEKVGMMGEREKFSSGYQATALLGSQSNRSQLIIRWDMYNRLLRIEQTNRIY